MASNWILSIMYWGLIYHFAMSSPALSPRKIDDRTCYGTSSDQISYFTTPDILEESCLFLIEVMNTKVCQIRLDFEKFSIAQPSKDNAGIFDAYTCQHDSFMTSSSFPPILCGENEGQHMYIPISTQTRDLLLVFSLADRSEFPTLAVPDWRIKATQIECLDEDEDNTFDLPEGQETRDELRIRAPDACLQYYPDRIGTYETFNYNKGKGPYIGNMNYAICFHRSLDVCGIRHTPSSFELAYNSFENGYTDSSCDSTSSVELPSEDYLYVPEGFTFDNIIASKYCGLAINATNFVTSLAPGPLDVYVRSDNIAESGIKESGFRINYVLLC